MNIALRGASVASFLVIGGCSFKREAGALTSVERITVEEKSGSPSINCEVVANLNVPRRSPSVFKTKDGVAVFGGCSAEFSHLDSVEVLSASSNKPFKPASTKIKSHSCAAFCNLKKGRGLIVGGYDGYDCLKDVSVIDLESMRVEKCLDFCSRLKNSCAVACEDESVLLFGGWDEQRTMKSVFRLKLDSDNIGYSSEMVGILPFPIEGHQCVRRGDNVFIVGGFDGISIVNKIVRYNTKTKESKILSIGLDVARENHVATLVNDEYILVAAGWNGKESLNSIELFRILEKEPYLERIRCETRLQVARNRPALVELENR